MPVLDKIAYLLNEIPGHITISGHTDDKPISTARFHSNWELSSARAITVAHQLHEDGVDKDRMIVSGYSDTQPLFSNDTDEHRSRNRRVEIVLTQDDIPRVQEAPDVAPESMRGQVQQPTREILVNQPPGFKSKNANMQENTKKSDKATDVNKDVKTKTTTPAPAPAKSVNQ